MSGRGKTSWHMRGGKSYGKYRGKTSKPYPKNSNNPSPNREVNISKIFEVEKSPYNAWTTYFPNEGKLKIHIKFYTL